MAAYNLPVDEPAVTDSNLDCYQTGTDGSAKPILREVVVLGGTASGSYVPMDNTKGLAVDLTASGTLATVTTVGTVSSVSSIAAVIPGVGATNLGKAEDAASASGDSGVMILAVRNATVTDQSAGATDGDYEPLQVSAAGRLWVSATVDAALPAGTNAIGKLAANSGVIIGDVNLVSAVPVGTNSIGKISDITTTVTPGTAAGNLGKAEDAASASGDTGVMILAVRNATVTDQSAGATDGDYEPLQVSAAGRLWVSATVDAALPAGANAIGKLAANSGVTIGAVELAAAQTLATVTTVTTVTTCSTVTTLTGGGVASGSADSGNPVKVGSKVLASPKGMTILADANRADLTSDVDKALVVKGWTTGADLISTSQNIATNTSTALTNFGAVASTKNFITSITVFNSNSATDGFVSLQDGSGGTTIWVLPAPHTGGATINFDPPLKQPTANLGLFFAASAAISTIYISVNGFQSKAY